MTPLTIEEKASIEFAKIAAAKKEWIKGLSPEQKEARRKFEAAHPEARKKTTRKQIEKRIRASHAHLDTLKEGGHYHVRHGIDIYDLFIDGPEHPEFNLHLEMSGYPITNLQGMPGIGGFFIHLENFYFQRMKFRGVSSSRLENVLQTGTDRDDMNLYCSEYFSKAIEYGYMPKLILVYKAEGIRYLGGNEGYEHEFTQNPKSLLICLLRIYQKDKAPELLLP